MKTVSAIVPTYNRLPRLKRVLAALEQQTVPPEQLEVLVVSDGSTDGTEEFLRELTTRMWLTPVFQQNLGVAAARNAGVARASGDLVLFLDDDVVPEPQLVKEHLRMHQEQGEGVVVLGPMLTPPNFKMKPWVRWEQAMLMKHYTAMQEGLWAPTPRQFYTGNASLERRHIMDVGGFDQTFRRAEDVELAYRLANQGLRFVFHPEAAAYHYAERSFQSWLLTPYTYGRNDVIFTQRKGQFWLAPVVFKEFHSRHLFIQLLTRICLGHPRITDAVIVGLQSLAYLGERINSEQMQRLAYSGIFNLRYYQGFADELGGREPFLKGVTKAAASREPVIR